MNLNAVYPFYALKTFVMKSQPIGDLLGFLSSALLISQSDDGSHFHAHV